ncbi:MAG: sigma 54-interacting transcriptional regulator [Planctomycetota bacterium]
MPDILLADPDPETAAALAEALRGQGADMVRALGADAALAALADHDFDLVIADWHLPGLCGSDWFRVLGEAGCDAAVIFTAAFGTVEDAVEALRAGARDFLCKPFTREQLALAVERALEGNRLVRENHSLRKALGDRGKFDRLVSSDPRMVRIKKTIEAVAPSRSTVLLTGESGTGKTLLARAIHRASDRSNGPFVEVNCGALPETLLESELFGHVKGAFTGAIRDRAGKFEAARGGTIFLDEIGTASPGLQVRLLRVLQDRVVERVGDSRSIPVDVRVVLATNVDLGEEVKAGRFREDLFYRIHVITIDMPPLRERRSDIPLLADLFLGRLRTELRRPVRGFTKEALAVLQCAPWPGNVRQLENVVERAVVLCEGEEIDVADLPPDLAIGIPTAQDAPGAILPEGAHLLPLKLALEGPERSLIERALEHFGGNRELAANSLGINRSTLFAKMRRLGIKDRRSQPQQPRR